MSARVAVKPEIVAWALRRADDLPVDDRLYQLAESWAAGLKQPTLKQLRDFAKRTHAPFGYFFGESPPEEKLPIADFRTLRGNEPLQPSANLLDTVEASMFRQEWHRNFCLRNDYPEVEFVGSARGQASPAQSAAWFRDHFEFEVANRSAFSDSHEAFRELADGLRASGILVFKSGVVGSNNRRKLDLAEFRGFSLSSRHSPLIFVNKNDSGNGQLFTLLHEFAHILRGDSGVSAEGLEGLASDVLGESRGDHGAKVAERWCNAFAAAVLVPEDYLLQAAKGKFSLDIAQQIARVTKASIFTVLRRYHELALLSWDEFRAHFVAEQKALQENSIERPSGGGNFYRTLRSRLGDDFVDTVIRDTQWGGTLHREAMQLLGVSAISTFDFLAKEVA